MRLKHIIICILILTSCNDINDYYSGYVVDERGYSISEVQVREYRCDGLHTVTDENGFFHLKRDKSFICNLIFEKEGYLPDTVLTFWVVDDNDTQYFSTIRSDTSKIILKKADTAFLK